MVSIRVKCFVLFSFWFGLSIHANELTGLNDLQSLLRRVELVLNKVASGIAQKPMKPPVRHRDCADIYMSGKTTSGIYHIQPTGWGTVGEFAVYCDMDTDQGGWTVFQRRGDFGFPIDYFDRTWKQYRNGFGELDREFWLGNDRLSALTKHGDYMLRIDLKDMDRNSTFAKYSEFKVNDASQLYRLHYSGYSGTAGDSLGYAYNLPFSTTYQDSPKFKNGGCINTHKGGWWYRSCNNTNLNALNLKGHHEIYADGVNWHTWKGNYYSLFSEMKLRPNSFASAE